MRQVMRLGRPIMSWINLGEVYYTVQREAGAAEAESVVTLLRLDGRGDDGAEDEYWIALENFYALTRYNHSNLYAMAVHQLGREIKALYLARESRQAAAP